jgi:NAD(P)-dependent dehydrogenase (short-subunit alcohol dehydrogenase family)
MPFTKINTMAKIFITGSADGLGHLTANSLVNQDHEVVLHARNIERGREALKKIKRASNVLTGDLSNMEETIKLADQVNSLGAFDVVIHNAGVYQRSGKETFAVNTIAPYILTCLIQKPKRLIYLSSGMHLQGRPNFDNFKKNVNLISYSDSKLHVLMLAFAIAQKRPDVYSNVVDPGWVPTKMGGRGAPDDLQKGYETQAWLAISDDDKAKVSGRYFYHQKERRHNPEADDVASREKFLALCGEITGIPFPLS